MAFDINNFVLDECKRVFSRNADSGAMNFLVAQIEDPSIQCDADEIVKNDAKGTPLAKWSSGKTAAFSASNSLLDFNLMSYQFNGEGKTVATSSVPVNAPAIEEKTFGSTDSLTEYTLANAAINSGTTASPVYKITVCTLTRDGACKKSFTIGAATAAGVCTYT